MTDEGFVDLVAYRINGAAASEDEDLWSAPVKRAWMETLPERFANRCLPMLLANQSGWLLINTDTVLLRWDGGRGTDAVSVEYPSSPVGAPALSHFGSGIVTWSAPYLFRTSAGWNLLVRGPANCPKDGIFALEGLVETDWTASTFTINWQLTRPGLEVTFERGEPLAMLVPQRRGELERVRPRIRPLSSVPELANEYSAWAGSRGKFLVESAGAKGQIAAGPSKWQKHYFQGRELSGNRRVEHQTRLRIEDFVDETRPAKSSDDEIGGGLNV